MRDHSPQPSQDPVLDRAVLQCGQEIFRRLENQSGSIFNKDWWYGRIMEWSMKNEAFKVQMFRFVDVLPYLNSSDEVARHLKEYFAEGGEIPSIFNVGMGLGSLAPGLMAGAVRKNVTQMAKMFIVGENAKEALPVLIKNRKAGLGFTVDILGEAALSEAEALDYQRRYIDLIAGLSKETRDWKPHSILDQDDRSAIPAVNVSIKVSSLFSQVNTKAWEATKDTLKGRLRPIFDLALRERVFVNLDMEQYSLKDMTIEIFEELLTEPAYAEYAHFGCVIQAYLKDSLPDVERLIRFAEKRRVPFTVRLVKGAYWDYETVLAEQRGWSVPVFTEKSASDANFEDCAKKLLDNHRVVRVALGSHNVRSIAASMVHAEKLGLPKSAFEVQMLYGMADPIKKAIVEMGYRVREYAPVGELIPGMAYLVRRLLENTSNESFLRSKFAENASSEKLLADPKSLVRTPANHSNGTSHEASTSSKASSTVSPAASRSLAQFKNEPLLDFGYAHVRKQMTEAISQRRKQLLGETSPLSAFIGGASVLGPKSFIRENPSHVSETWRPVTLCTVEQAQQSVEAAHKAFSNWRKTKPEERAALVDRVADMMRDQRYQLAATQVLEVGKPWAEADGDVCEAIDFCRYYAQSMRELALGNKSGSVAGETNHYHYVPRGVTSVIAPWNFPLAIMCGMTVGALVTGNTVIIKPAEQSLLVAREFVELLFKAGFPKEAIQFLPGIGEEVGPVITDHPLVSTIVFTGSRQVGLQIIEKAAKVHPGQKWVKRGIAEMGGKNAVIVDSDADLDEAVTGIVYSAFGFAGQKCSACSRVIVLDEIYDRFVTRLAEAAKSIHVGKAEDPQSYLGPVVDEEARTRIERVIASASGTAKLLFQGSAPAGGHFVGPTIFVDVDPKSDLAQNEIFGPVLAVIRASTFDQALEIANDTQYGLTGGLFSRSPARIEQAKAEFEVGNLYINRQITGALVHRHPFGGFKMSGVGSKTGGRDYLLQFMDQRNISENTLRRGFAPSDEAAGTETGTRAEIGH